MLKNIRDIQVYHGSYTEVQIPDLKKCRANKDFGKGFYITTDKKQAEKFAKLIARRAKMSYGVLNVYHLSDLDNLSTYHFKTADLEWLNCVSGNRNTDYHKLAEEWEKYDVLSGKVADDDTSTVINAYLSGLLGEVGSESAGRIAIDRLEPENLKNQFCLRSDKALEKIEFVKSEVIPIGKRG